MRAEHCIKHGHSFSFTTGNYHITTTPLKEWEYVVGHRQGYPVPCPDMGSGRRLRALEQLMRIPLTVKSGLTRAEVIAVVLYTGPMVLPLDSSRNHCMLVPLSRHFTLLAVPNLQQYSTPLSCRHLRILFLSPQYFFNHHLCPCVGCPKDIPLYAHCPRDSVVPRPRGQIRAARFVPGGRQQRLQGLCRVGFHVNHGR